MAMQTNFGGGGPNGGAWPLIIFDVSPQFYPTPSETVGSPHWVLWTRPWIIALTPRPHRVRQRITHSFYDVPHHAPVHIWG